MGRAHNAAKAVTALAPVGLRHERNSMAKSVHQLSLSPTARMIARYQRQLKGADLAGAFGEERDSRRYKATGYLSDTEMKSLIRFSRSCVAELEQASNSGRKLPPAALSHLRQMADAARELFVISSYGMVNLWLRGAHARFLARFEEQDPERKREIAYQIARETLLDIIDRLADPENEAHILTYANAVIATRLRDAIVSEQGGPTMSQGKRTRDMMKMQGAVAALRRQRGHQTTISAAEVEELSGVDREFVDEMFAQVLSGPPVRLDGPVVVHDFEDHVRSQTRTGLMELLGAPYANDSAEDEFFTQETQERVRGVIAGLSPFDRALATAQFGLAGEPVEQKHLYNGVYRDATGNVFTVEETVRKAWDANNPDNLAQTAKQVELNRLFKEGKLRWEPMTREAQQLSQLLAAERSADDVGQMVGVPLTSGIVQDRLEHLALKLAADENLLVDRPRYRGDFELQNSGTACELVRRALSVVGALSATEAATLKAGRANMKEGEVGKSPLTAAAVKQGWVSEQTGKVNWTQLHEDVRARKREVARSRNGLESTDELAELMASA